MSNINQAVRQSIHSRVEMVNGMFNLSDDHKKAMSEVREILSEAAHKLENLSSNAKFEIDVGRWIHAFDLIQQAKNCACDAIILPNGPKLNPDV